MLDSIVRQRCVNKRQTMEKRVNTDICIFVRNSLLKRSGVDHTVFTLQTHHICLYL